MHHISPTQGADAVRVLRFDYIFFALGSASVNDIEMHASMGSALLTLEFAVLLNQKLG